MHQIPASNGLLADMRRATYLGGMRMRVVVGTLLLTAMVGAQQHEVAGVVRSDDRAPQANVAVTVRWRIHPELPGICGHTLPDDGVASRVMKTDERGRFRAQLPVAGPFELIAASADGKRMSIRRFPVMAGGFTELQLIETPWVGGIVNDAFGNPLRGFELALEPFEQTWARHRGCGSPITRYRVTTGDDGRWRCAFPSGYLKEPFWEPYLVPVAANRTSLVEGGGLLMPDQRCRQLELNVKEMSVVDGVVRDDNGAPVTGARVFDPYGVGGEARSDDNGRFRVSVANADRLHVVADGMLRQNSAETEKGLRVFRLVRAPKMRAKLQDASGAPLANRSVLWRDTKGRWPSLEHWTRTDDGGETWLGGAGLGAGSIGFVDVDGVYVPFVRSKSGGPVRIAVRAIAGTVLDADGVPVAGARITARSREQVYVDGGDPLWVTYTDHGGRFRLPSVPQGEVVLVVNAGASGFAVRGLDAKTHKVALQTGKDEAFEIEVVDGDDKPCAGAWITMFSMNGVDADIVAASPNGSASLVTFSGEDGRASIRGVPGGGWFAMAMRVVDGQIEASEMASIGRGATTRIALAPHKR